MKENERMIEPEMNPYDHLIEPDAAPVRSPVILGNADEPEKAIKSGSSMEIIPLASGADYSKITVREYRCIDVINVEVEEDLLVPDTYPDMETILNMDALAVDTDIYTENGESEIKGKVTLETLYRSDETYGSNLSLLPAELDFKTNLKTTGQIYLHIQIRKVEYRIMNERKYKAKVSLVISVKCQNETEHMLFEGIEGETLHVHKEKVNLLDMVSRKTDSCDISGELLLNDEKIRPVKILKSKVTVAENHRQLTKEKLVLNQTLWVRVLYMAEISSKGNLSNQAMFFQGKIDNTQFISLGKSEGEAVSCTSTSAAENMKIEINREFNGFELSGEVVTDVICYGIVKNEMVTDFYHDKEEMTCDRNIRKVYTDAAGLFAEHTVRESISLQQGSGEELRIIYLDAQPVDTMVEIEGMSAVVRGKLHLEAVIMNEGDYTILAKKICDFTCVKELPQRAAGQIETDCIFVREITGDISGSNVNLTAQIQVNMNIYNEAEIEHINNPCIIRSGVPAKHYPITVHTVMEGETVWDIGKKYKVSGERVTEYNSEENIRPGKKIIIVK